MNSSNPLDNYPLVRSRDIEEVCDAIGRIYARPAVAAAAGNVAAIDAAVNNCRLRHTALAYGRYGAPVSLQYPATGLFVQLFPVRGVGEVVRGSRSAALGPGTGTVIAPGAAYTMSYTR